MQILLTGGSGSVGKAVVERLVNKGFGVRVIGRRPEMHFEGAEYRACDINDTPSLREAIRGCQAVVHLAAVPNPKQATPDELFRVNCSGTFNVCQAAAEEGIRRVVQASSINAAGQFYGIRPAPLHYLPMDEEHPVFSTDAYSFSKNVIEATGEYFWRREGISNLAYRLPWVAPAEVHDQLPQRQARLKSLVDELMALPQAERRAWFDQAWQAYNEFRAGRPYEGAVDVRAMLSEMEDGKRAAFSAMTSRVNFFTMLDERDSAQAVEKGLTADFEGSHTLFINDSHNNTGVDSRTLAALFYPDVTTFKQPLEGDDTLVSIDQARRLIGFEPEYSFVV